MLAPDEGAQRRGEACLALGHLERLQQLVDMDDRHGCGR
jgi:hypothetical protein